MEWERKSSLSKTTHQVTGCIKMVPSPRGRVPCSTWREAPQEKGRAKGNLLMTLRCYTWQSYAVHSLAQLLIQLLRGHVQIPSRVTCTCVQLFTWYSDTNFYVNHLDFLIACFLFFFFNITADCVTKTLVSGMYFHTHFNRIHNVDGIQFVKGSHHFIWSSWNQVTARRREVKETQSRHLY